MSDLTLHKVRASNLFRFDWTSGGKTVSWVIDPEEVDREILLDIYNTTHPYTVPLEPTAPAIPLTGPGSTQPPLPYDWNHAQVLVDRNPGQEDADRAARAEEQRLMNMGAALKQGINMGPEDIPVFNDEGDLPPVNWLA